MVLADRAHPDPGVVDQDVEAAAGGAHVGDGHRAVLRAGDVGLDPEHVLGAGRERRAVQSTTATLAPTARRPTAIAAPMPRAPPVTSATLPAAETAGVVIERTPPRQRSSVRPAAERARIEATAPEVAADTYLPPVHA